MTRSFATAGGDADGRKGGRATRRQAVFGLADLKCALPRVSEKSAALKNAHSNFMNMQHHFAAPNRAVSRHRFFAKRILTYGECIAFASQGAVDVINTYHCPL